jgi:ABC-type Co2+ transport system permease subunit
MMGEKRRKNFPLVRSFMVMMMMPAMPKPMSNSLHVIGATLRRC